MCGNVHVCNGPGTHLCGNVHASDGTVITHVWQCTRKRWARNEQHTRVLWRCGNCLFRQASRDHIDLEHTKKKDTQTEFRRVQPSLQ
jgi:hypothetical protein